MLSRAFERTNPASRLLFFENGSELVQYYQVHREFPTVLLLALQMPVMGGLEALRAIKADGFCDSIPIVIFSSLENPETIRLAYEAGAKLYLKKPDLLERLSGCSPVLCGLCRSPC